VRLRPSTPGSRTAAVTSIALAVLLCIWPTRVNAGCSHYVVPDTQYERLAEWLDTLGRRGRVNVSSEAPVRPKPCSGALCSGKPAAPVPVPIAVSRPLGAVVPHPLVPPAPPAIGRRLAHAERIVRAVIEGPSIDRPPR
jgi:hypothetical protein